MSLRTVRLADKFDLTADPVFLNGAQAMVRLCLLRGELDRRAGLRTAGYITGYRGSPVGGLDLQFAAAAGVLEPANIIFEPGLNEDLAATALWGTQQAELRGDGAQDGVFGMWYGKGPGVDRSGDVFRHANLAGSSRHGGVLLLMGDDHTCESSTTCHQSEFALVDAMIPILNPANLQEMIDYGLHGWELSRFAGVWCGLKCVKDNIESTGVIESGIGRFRPVHPAEFALPEDGLNIRPNDPPRTQEARLHQYKMGAVEAYVRANRLNRTVLSGGAKPRLGVVSTGKSWLDTLQALEALGIDEHRAAQLGLAAFKVAMPWPLEGESISRFARGLELLIVVEEKRGLVEGQLRQCLYGRPDAPAVIGKRAEDGGVLFQAEGALDPVQIAAAIGTRLGRMTEDAALQARAAALAAGPAAVAAAEVERTPYFCAGCPHNSSTVIPEGARGYAGIGCHWMVQFLDRNTEGYTHMGGEGANWIGESHFSRRRHIFQNLGDGTFNHSGLLALRAACAADTNMTFKILYNDAVAMTGGQAHEGGMDVAQVAAECAAAGARRIALVSDDPKRHDPRQLPPGCTIAHRDRIDAVQRTLAAEAGVTVLIYEQTCAAEKRRRRKRGTMADPPRRIFINETVCEGCGDCGVQSNCIAILPQETPLGRKRQIDQTACNRDYSCLKGFCPSFVTVEGGALRQPAAVISEPPAVPDPAPLPLAAPFSILITGIGGTGVVTIGALLGMAAHLEGRGCGIIDMAGLAQKGGAVVSHLKIAPCPADIKAIRVARGGTDLLLGGDLVVSANPQLVQLLDPARSRIVVNNHAVMPGTFVQDPDLEIPSSLMQRQLADRALDGTAAFFDATEIARTLIGDTIAANLVLLGAAFQHGLLPLGADAIETAIRLNGVAVEANLNAFRWGRAQAHAPGEVAARLATARGPTPAPELSLDATIAMRREFLTAYQNRTYAERYRRLVQHARDLDQASGEPLAWAVAENAFRLMAYKDEYEVARLYTDGTFAHSLRAVFAGNYRLRVHLAPPILSRTDPATGRPRKRAFGSWIFPLLRALAALRGVRGTVFDPFGYAEERRQERALLREYERFVRQDLDTLVRQDAAAALELARLPATVRGYGPVKLAGIDCYRQRRTELLARIRSQGETRPDAA